MRSKSPLDMFKLEMLTSWIRITVSFSIADLQNYDPDLFEEDAALSDEDFSNGGRNADQSASGAAEMAEDLDAEGDGTDAAIPCRLNVIIEKPGQGALAIEATASDGNILVENMYHYPDAALAHSESAESAHKAQDVYAGPPFGSLDEDLQILIERYLEERGITQALAVFVPDYMDMKEQKEYLTWLNSVKNFVDA
jgi:complement component 1 Q subcomponent-binding protein